MGKLGDDDAGLHIAVPVQVDGVLEDPAMVVLTICAMA